MYYDRVIVQNSFSTNVSFTVPFLTSSCTSTEKAVQKLYLTYSSSCKYSAVIISFFVLFFQNSATCTLLCGSFCRLDRDDKILIKCTKYQRY